VLKRGFDVFGAAIGLGVTFWLIGLVWVLASIDTRANGFYIQERIGKDGRRFQVVKIRTMRSDSSLTSTVTCSGDPRVTRLGIFFRKTKLDELPQLWNVLLGHMSFVGPRPDVPGFADRLKGEERAILRLRPGITGPATLKYRDEEATLAGQPDPERYNREVIWPDKVRINLEYMRSWSLKGDIHYVLKTVFGTSRGSRQ
jgi:lipopolysaccharide/colanic/teichoic acid biosynthesis glycosyltransferase